jgi:RNA polymerase sigma factor (sigma-70 family)
VNDTRSIVLKATDPETTLTEKHEAFGEIVRRFQDMAYACAFAMLGDFHLAEDAAQEAFITAWQKLHQLRRPEAFPGWLRRIVLTECNRLRRRKEFVITPLDEGACVSSIDENPQSAIERNELRRSVFAAIQELPLKEREIVTFFYLKEQTQIDISEFLEVPLTTVAKRLYSARVRLRGKMTKEFKTDLTAHLPSRDRTFAEKVTAGVFDEYVGDYRFELRPDLTVTIKREGNQLISEASGQRNELFATKLSDTELLTKEFDGKGQFVRNKAGRISHFIYFEFGHEMGVAKRLN